MAEETEGGCREEEFMDRATRGSIPFNAYSPELQARPGDPDKWRPVNINRVENGFIIEIGCKVFVATTWIEAADGLAEYWDNPRKAQKKYCKED